MGQLLITPLCHLKSISVLIIKMFRAGAPDPVQGLVCLLASQSKKKPKSRFFFYDVKVLGLYRVN